MSCPIQNNGSCSSTNSATNRPTHREILHELPLAVHGYHSSFYVKCYGFMPQAYARLKGCVYENSLLPVKFSSTLSFAAESPSSLSLFPRPTSKIKCLQELTQCRTALLIAQKPTELTQKCSLLYHRRTGSATHLLGHAVRRRCNIKERWINIDSQTSRPQLGVNIMTSKRDPFCRLQIAKHSSKILL